MDDLRFVQDLYGTTHHWWRCEESRPLSVQWSVHANCRWQDFNQPLAWLLFLPVLLVDFVTLDMYLFRNYKALT